MVAPLVIIFEGCIARQRRENIYQIVLTHIFIQKQSQIVQMVMLRHIVDQKIVILCHLDGLSIEIVHRRQWSFEPQPISFLFAVILQINQVEHQHLILVVDLPVDHRRF